MTLDLLQINYFPLKVRFIITGKLLLIDKKVMHVVNSYENLIDLPTQTIGGGFQIDYNLP